MEMGCGEFGPAVMQITTDYEIYSNKASKDSTFKYKYMNMTKELLISPYPVAVCTTCLSNSQFNWLRAAI